MKLILQDSNHVTRSEFYGKNLAELGVPLSDALSPPKVALDGFGVSGFHKRPLRASGRKWRSL